MMGKYEYEIGPGMYLMHSLRAEGETLFKQSKIMCTIVAEMEIIYYTNGR